LIVFAIHIAISGFYPETAICVCTLPQRVDFFKKNIIIAVTKGCFINLNQNKKMDDDTTEHECDCGSCPGCGANITEEKDEG
jgi:hypothetical protein